MKHFGILTVSLVLSVGVGAGQKIEPQLRALDQQEKTNLQSLNQQMADLKEKHLAETTPLQQQLASLNSAFDSAMKQLRDQYDATRNQDNQERATLMDRIKPGYLALYNDKQQSLANVNGQEEQSAQSLRQQEDAELASIREKYEAQIKGVRQEATAQRQTIDNQFDTAVKALK